jgi:hypothetical protein
MKNSTIVNDGVFTVANGQTITDANPPAAPPAPVLPPTSLFINYGSFIKNAGTAATTIGVPLINVGSLSFNGTLINFASTVTQTGPAAVTDLGGGTMTLTGANLVAGTPNGTTFVLSAGELTGTAGATINGSLSNSGLVDFGTAFGALTINGNYAQTASGTLIINVGADGSIDLLNVSGFANLSGHLQVVGVQGGTSYLILQAASGVNMFADVTAPWTALYDTDPVYNVSIE